jgi:sterol desaturase/sphingolipid hydroxylase (fatty acid hydroxylase superfamily)
MLALYAGAFVVTALLAFAVAASLVGQQTFFLVWFNVSSYLVRHAEHALFSRAGIQALAVLALIFIELAFLDWDRTSLYRLFVRRSTSAKIDVAYYLLLVANIVPFLENFFSLGIAIMGTRLANAVSTQLGAYRIELPADGFLPIAAGFCVYWFASSLFEYWTHRLLHFPLLWHVHRFHHAATELNVVTAFRVHPAESVTRIFAVLSPLIFFKVPDIDLLIFFVIGGLSTFLAHGELPWTYGWIGRWIVAAPAVHQVHHSRDEVHRDKNFCTCPLWDHAFGTWYDGSSRPSGYGTPDRSYEERPMLQWIQDTWALYSDAAKWTVGQMRRLRGPI